MSELSLKRPKSLQDQVADTLEKKLFSGDWPKGSRIPTEPDLCATLKVSRTILREAISKLKSKGLLESRQGSGVFVIRNRLAPILRIENAGMKQIEALRELMELRFSVEINTAYMAALRRTEPQIQALQIAHEALCDAVEKNALGDQEDIAFHLAIAEASNNSHFCQFLQFIQTQVEDTVKAARTRSAAVKGRPQQVIAEHFSLLTAIKDGNPEAARSAAWKHQLNAAKRMGIRGLLAWEGLRLTHLQAPRQLPPPRSNEINNPPQKPLPGNTCDTHVSLFGDPAHYPLINDRSYTPSHGTDFAAYKQFQSEFGIDRAVFIQASVYGSDNSLLLDTLRQATDDQYRGVAVVDQDIKRPELERMHRLGVRALRVNRLYRNGGDNKDLPGLAEIARSMGWHIDLQADVSEFHAFYDEISALDMPVVVDHMGHIPSDIGIQSQGFQDLLKLLKEGKIWVRLTGFCRLSTHETLPFSDIKPYVDTLLETRPDRLLWGSDWPHPAVDFTPPSEAELFTQFSEWISDDSLLKNICVDNPTKLYWAE